MLLVSVGVATLFLYMHFHVWTTRSDASLATCRETEISIETGAHIVNCSVSQMDVVLADGVVCTLPLNDVCAVGTFLHVFRSLANTCDYEAHNDHCYRENRWLMPAYVLFIVFGMPGLTLAGLALAFLPEIYCYWIGVRSSRPVRPSRPSPECVSDCSICLETVSKPGRILPCRHAFHEACIARWLHDHEQCPLCRATV